MGFKIAALTAPAGETSEDIVFAMIRETLGFSLDQVSEKLRRFETAPVQRITEKKGLLTTLFGRR